MRYQITHSCGHISEVQLYGAGKDRERRMEWLRNNACPSCHREAKRAEGPAFMIREGAGGHEAICYQNSYDIREKLKARGYQFGEVWGPGHGVLDLGEKPSKGWSKQGLSAEEAIVEEDWISLQGWKVEIPSAIANIFAALREGRPDLLKG